MFLPDKRVYPKGGVGVGTNTPAKLSNSSVFNSVKSTSSYPRGGVFHNQLKNKEKNSPSWIS